ncbi:MAG TPA: hypothetical protein VGR15_03690 [Bacteroidota bacterium]|jgi:hypothetical protein|nr:hypothetical protein [Bacteroidota bacterium]
MKKTIVGGIVGGIILFVWSFLAWVLLPLHEPTLHQIPDEDAAISALQPLLNEKAVYVFPKMPPMGADQATVDKCIAKIKRGPVGMIVYDPAGSDPMMPGQMAVGLIVNILSAWVVAWFLIRSTAVNASFISRVAYCGMFGVFVSLFAHLTNWNWMGFPVDFTSRMVIDALLSWIIAGLGIASIVKMPKEAI